MLNGERMRIIDLTMEHLLHLETPPAARFQFGGLPLRIKGATGSPIRAIAMIENEGGQA